MKIKVSNATPTQLDWLVAKCWYSDEFDKDRVFLYHSGFDWAEHTVRIANQATCTRDLSFEWEPTTNWSQGGPLIERERIRLEPLPDKGWRAYLPVKQGLWVDAWGDRATPLRVAMECFVASKLGDAVDVPDELGEHS